ncbi:hypothetical protein FGIG_08282 [Fasciola gigantica]|uniref:Uncharacterized protein n=1 Tax=Fasciola gigantica TaxID=46835 RepID=A0A504YRD8_FASGI|nr:hypothetical protein FGIG_08282 [Fasciola gigantica]
MSVLQAQIHAAWQNANQLPATKVYFEKRTNERATVPVQQIQSPSPTSPSVGKPLNPDVKPFTIKIIGDDSVGLQTSHGASAAQKVPTHMTHLQSWLIHNRSLTITVFLCNGLEKWICPVSIRRVLVLVVRRCFGPKWIDGPKRMTYMYSFSNSRPCRFGPAVASAIVRRLNDNQQLHRGYLDEERTHAESEDLRIIL